MKAKVTAEIVVVVEANTQDGIIEKAVQAIAAGEGKRSMFIDDVDEEEESDID